MQSDIRAGIRALLQADTTLTKQERDAVYASLDTPLASRRPVDEVVGCVVKIPEVAKLLSVSRSRVYQLIQEKRLRAVYERPKAEGGRAIGVTLASLDTLVNGERTKTEDAEERLPQERR